MIRVRLSIASRKLRIDVRLPSKLLGLQEDIYTSVRVFADKNVGTDVEQDFRELVRAYEVLSDARCVLCTIGMGTGC